ncbi:hypothetical protein cypCar_00016686 [Cyprinus carpio]|nr:hypothetical protein cypCar_00016686 [Cyprinus carpio]
MDLNSLIEALRGTMDANLREAAERQLNEGHTQVNFLSTLLQVTMTDQLDLPVRQAVNTIILGIEGGMRRVADSAAAGTITRSGFMNLSAV